MKKYITSLTLLVVAFLSFNVLQVYADGEAKSSANNALFVDQANNLIGESKQLTFVGTRSGEGYFSADGKQMIYQSEREEGNPFYQMFILNLESGKSTRISTGQGMTTCGWINPNLKKAMWSSTHLDKDFKKKAQAEYDERAKPVKKRYSWSYDDQYDIFESDLNGKHIKRLTKELGYDAEGSYSPDGKHIAFASNRSQYKDKFTDEEKKILEKDPSYAMEIYIMDVDGKNVKRLTNEKGYDGGPFFSADGKKIVWRRFTPDGNRAEVYSMNIDGSDQRQITHLNAMSWAPFFHPSGQYIVFSSSVLGYSNFELFIVDSEGQSKPVRVSFSEGFDGLASFSPDGKQITWTHRNEKGESQIYLAKWDHEQALKLLQTATKSKAAQLNLSPEIKLEDTQQIIKYLASDEFKGRMTGSEEEKIYTTQIADLFRSWGLEPAVGKSFIQNFEFVSAVTLGAKNNLELKGRFSKSLKLGEDFQVLSYAKSGDFAAAPLVFVGLGIKSPATDKIAAFDSYHGLDVKSKWVLILDQLPNTAEKEVRQHLISYSSPQHKITVAKNNGATGVIFITDSGLKELKFEGSLADSSLPVLKISSKVINQILAASDSAVKSYSQLEAEFEKNNFSEGFNLNSQYASANIELTHIHSIGRNVIAKLNPIKANKKVKSILVGAHGDHLGLGERSGSSLARASEKGKIHYGADDNASGVAGVLELAHYFSEAKNKAQLKKPLYFAVWSGEEIGVLGSNYFVKNWKQESKLDFNKSFEAALNMDMIGRFRDKLQVQGVASAKQWSGLSEEVGLISGVPLMLTSDPYLPTDSMSFYLGNIPSISFFTGSHEEYHSPRDTYETINFAGLVKAIDVVRLFTQKVADVSSQVVSYEKVEGNSGQKLEGRSFRIYLGTIPDYSQEGVKGVKISGTSKNSPAEKAGLVSGDVIVDFDTAHIENLYDYVYALQSAKADKAVKIVVLRGDKKLELQITPVLRE